MTLLPSAAWASSEAVEHAPTMAHRMMMLAMQLGVIVLAARFGNILFTRLKLPGVVGELMTGVIIGPFV